MILRLVVFQIFAKKHFHLRPTATTRAELSKSLKIRTMWRVCSILIGFVLLKTSYDCIIQYVENISERRVGRLARTDTEPDSSLKQQTLRRNAHSTLPAIKGLVAES